MAKDRARDIRRSTGSLAKMGAALGWDRTSHQGVTSAHKTEDKDKASQGYYSKGSFVPGAGHVDDGVPHRGWLGIGGSRKGMAE